MIDTIKLKIPDIFTDVLQSRLDSFTSSLIKFDNEGVIEWESDRVDSLPSSYSKIRITCYNNFFIEFSLQKQQSAVNYNHRNTNLGSDIVFFISWWEKFTDFLNIYLPVNVLEIARIDLSRNYLLNDEVDYLDFFRDLEVALSVRSDKRCNHYDSSIYYPSRWITKKLYHKNSELKALHRKGKIDKHKVYEDLKLADLHQFDKVIRFEMEYKKQALQNKGIFYIGDIRKLQDHFCQEENKIIHSINKVSCLSPDVLPSTLKFLYDLVTEYGYSLGRKKYIQIKSERSFQRNHEKLKKQFGINLRSVITDVRQKKRSTNHYSLSVSNL